MLLTKITARRNCRNTLLAVLPVNMDFESLQTPTATWVAPWVWGKLGSEVSEAALRHSEIGLVGPHVQHDLAELQVLTGFRIPLAVFQAKR